MNFRSMLVALASFFIVLPVFAKSVWHGDWWVHVSRDKFTDKVKVQAWAFGEKKYNDRKDVGIRCMDPNEISLTFSAVSFISFGNNYVSVRVRVDKEPSETFVGRLYSNADDSGWVPLVTHNGDAPVNQSKKIHLLIAQMQKGRRLLVEVANKHRSNIEHIEVSLKGFAKAYNVVKKECQ